jgi:hypothetical protein
MLVDELDVNSNVPLAGNRSLRSCEENEESRQGCRLATMTGCPTFVIHAAAWGRQSCLQAGVLASFLSEQYE